MKTTNHENPICLPVHKDMAATRDNRLASPSTLLYYVEVATTLEDVPASASARLFSEHELICG